MYWRKGIYCFCFILEIKVYSLRNYFILVFTIVVLCANMKFWYLSTTKNINRILYYFTLHTVYLMKTHPTSSLLRRKILTGKVFLGLCTYFRENCSYTKLLKLVCVQFSQRFFFVSLMMLLVVIAAILKKIQMKVHSKIRKAVEFILCLLYLNVRPSQARPTGKRYDDQKTMKTFYLFLSISLSLYVCICCCCCVYVVCFWDKNLN